MARESPHRIAIANANVPNMVGQISTTMAQAGLNIHNMVNKSKGEMAYTLVDLDSGAAPELIAAHLAHPRRALDPQRPAGGRSARMSDAGPERLRDAIDRVDDGILEALNERAKLAREIGTLKVGQAYRPSARRRCSRASRRRTRARSSAETVALLFREIMSACLALERPITVAYLGPQGTFSERAALKQFGIAPRPLPTPSIDEVFRAVESGGADFGVIPVENSTEGAVGRSLDLMPQTPIKVCGESGGAHPPSTHGEGQPRRSAM
jgi:chorismate mutase